MEFTIRLLPDFKKWFESVESDKELQAEILVSLSLMQENMLRLSNEIGSDIFEYEINNNCWIYFLQKKKDILIITGSFKDTRVKTIEWVLEDYSN